MRKAIRLAVAVLAAGVFAPACSHEVESPGPSSLDVANKGIDPDLACNATPVSRQFSTITLRGSNLTPMPQKTLEDKRQLMLPKVELTMVTPLAGAAPLTAPLTIADDPSNPTASRVKWTSESEMAFEIHEEDKLPTGVMSIKVTNPDGKQSTDFQGGNLAIVPKPTINELKPVAICDDQSDQTVIVAGQNFLFFDDKGPTVAVGDKTYTAQADSGAMCETVSGSFREKDVKLCNSVKITIPKGDFPVTTPTKVPVKLTNPAPADCQSSETIELTINPPPKVTSVVPATVCSGGSTITIGGEGFITGAKAIIDCMGTRVESSTTTVTPDGKELQATFGPGATPGSTCDVIVQNPDGCEDRPLPHKTVTVTPGPIVFYSDPPVVYNGVNTQITVFATTISGDPTITINPSGAATPVTTLVDTAVTGHPNRRQATIPTGQAAGDYDIKLSDATGCSAILPKGVKVVSDLTVTIKNVVPPFGWTGEDTAITVFRDTAAAAPKNVPFQNGARIFLIPSTAVAGDVAVPLVGTSFIPGGDRLSGTVPKGTAVKNYDIMVVNPDGSIGLLKNAYNELDIANPPPVVSTATPSSIVTATGQTVVLVGKNFDADAKVTVTCKDATGATFNAPATNTAPTGGGTTITATIDGSGIPLGSACVVRVTNTADGTYFDFSAIGVTNSSFNLSAPQKGTDMNVARRALSAASGDATFSQRFVYAIGGDNGSPAGALNTYEFAPVDLFGKMSGWVVSPVPLGAKRTLAGSTTVGRYIYIVGGNDGTGPVDTAERAMILSPLESPEINDVDLSLDAAGLDEGFYQYRVSATFATTDTDNPNGESLASDVFSIRIPAFPGKKIGVTLVWRKPVDSLGATLPNITGYKIFRIAKDGAAGSETLLGTVTGADTLTFKDDGSKTPGTEAPLPLGSTGQWFNLPNMGTKRSGVGVASAFDPADPTTMYVYAIMGNNTATTATGTYEYLKVTIAPNGRQAAAGAWTAGATAANAAPRSELGVWVATRATSTLVTAGDTWIFAGGGKTPSGFSKLVDAAKVTAGTGALSAWDTTPQDFNNNTSGYGVCAANGRLYTFGGQNGAPDKGASAGIMTSPVPSLANSSWNSEGLSMTQLRYLLGSSVQSAFIFLLGGQTSADAASKTTETVIW